MGDICVPDSTGDADGIESVLLLNVEFSQACMEKRRHADVALELAQLISLLSFATINDKPALAAKTMSFW